MESKKSDNESASLYDYFYYDYEIISKLLDLDSVEIFLKQNNIQLEGIWKAYLYTIELSLTDLYDHIEHFINDYKINRFLIEYDDNFPAYIVETYLKKDPYIRRIYSLDDIRKEFQILRKEQTFVREKISSIFKKLQTVLDETDIFIKGQYDVKMVIVDSASIKYPILNYIINIYGYVRYPNIPISPFFRTLSRSKVLVDYTTNRLKNSKQYIQGYVIFFFYLCKSFNANINYNIKYTVNSLNDLRDLNEISSKIYKDNITDLEPHLTYIMIFKMSEKPIRMVKYFKKAITRFEQLEFLFGNCDVKVINPRDFFGKGFFSGGETKTDDFLLTILYGELNRLRIGEQLEIIRFSHYIKEKMEDTWYSYAFYMRAGYWLVFDGITYDTDNLKYQLDNLIKRNKSEIEYTTLQIKDQFLRSYYKKKDQEIRLKNYEKGLEGNILGLLTEFAAIVYLLRCQNATITDIRVNTNNTDVDVQGVREDVCFIVQAKKSLPVEKIALSKKIREINKHFKKLGNYKINGKVPIKILFFIGWKYPSGEDEPENIILTRWLFLSRELLKKNILLASYNDLDFTLTKKGENNLNEVIKKVLGFEDGFVFS